MGFDLYGVKPKSKNGEYFRASVWGWRPIWEYVCTHHSDIVDSDIQKEGQTNSGYVVKSHIANKLADALHVALQDGTVSDFVEEINERVRKAKEHNKKLEVHFQLLREEAIRITGDKNIAPVSYPSDLDQSWKFLYSLTDRNESYSTDIEYIEEFQEFCKHSGGFSIC